MHPSIDADATTPAPLRSPSRSRPLAVALALCLTGALAACDQGKTPRGSDPDPESVVRAAQDAVAEAQDDMAEAASEVVDSASEMAADVKLTAVLAAQPESIKARYEYRHPQETLEFFGIEPGMTVVEALPGGGWYTKILVPYLGTEGMLIGVDYNPSLYPLFGMMSDEALAAKDTWPEDWVETARGWFDAPVATIDAYQFGSLSSALDGRVDAVLFIRALHNLARFDDKGDFLSEALADAYRVLKPGGVLGVVQHMAPESAPDAWASGDAGYLKKSFVVARAEQAGFELVDESNVNVNPKDQPTADDRVWRLPPTLAGAQDDPELAEERRAIGESTRMTLKFRKAD
jgi:predicted methyltransferase